MAKWPYNTSAWERLRKMHLREEPLCRFCKAMGRMVEGQVVDHIVKVQDRPDLAFDPDNLQTLCATCHSAAKQREEVRGQVIGAAVDGTPLDPAHHWNG